MAPGSGHHPAARLWVPGASLRTVLTAHIRALVFTDCVLLEAIRVHSFKLS